MNETQEITPSKAKKLCSKGCGRPQRNDHAYCSECLRAWKQKRRQDRDERRFTRGVETLRNAAIKAFDHIGLAEMNGYTAVEIMKGLRIET